jgi:16S rRNA (guanine527-N7)-methyltransferase
VIRNHFLDSLSCILSSLIRSRIRLLDIGAGAGFPCIPLKIYTPDIYVTAVDAVSKKMVFLRHLCRLLQLRDVECVASRVESHSPLSSSLPETSNNKEMQRVVPEKSFDIIVSRAVGTIPDLLELAEPFLGPDGHILLQRGRNGKREISDHAIFLQEKGFQIVDVIKVMFSFFNYPRYLTLFRKIPENGTNSTNIL